jgi:hypothetical protein
MFNGQCLLKATANKKENKQNLLSSNYVEIERVTLYSFITVLHYNTTLRHTVNNLGDIQLFLILF